MPPGVVRYMVYVFAVLPSICIFIYMLRLYVCMYVCMVVVRRRVCLYFVMSVYMSVRLYASFSMCVCMYVC